MTKLDKEIQDALYDPQISGAGLWVYHPTKKKMARIMPIEHWNDMSAMGQPCWHEEEPSSKMAYLKLQKRGYRLYDPKSSPIPLHWYEAMVRGIKKSSDVRNPYAVVKSIWAKLTPSKRAEIKAREDKGERFRYDLPLPVDKPTKGTGTVRLVKPFNLAEVQVNLSVRDYLSALKSGLFSKMKRQDGTMALVARCKSPSKNANIFIDKIK